MVGYNPQLMLQEMLFFKVFWTVCCCIILTKVLTKEVLYMLVTFLTVGSKIEGLDLGKHWSMGVAQHICWVFHPGLLKVPNLLGSLIQKGGDCAHGDNCDHL